MGGRCFRVRIYDLDSITYVGAGWRSPSLSTWHVFMSAARCGPTRRGQAVPAAVAAGQGAPAGLRGLVQRGRGQHHLLRDPGPGPPSRPGRSRPTPTSGSWSSCPRSSRTSAGSPVSRPRCGRSWTRSNPSANGRSCGSSCPARSAPRTSTPSAASCADSPPTADAPWRCATPPSSPTPARRSLLERTLADADAEWVPFDTTVFFQQPADQRGRAGRVDQETPAAAADAGADRPADRPLPGPRLGRGDGRGLAAVDRGGRRTGCTRAGRRRSSCTPPTTTTHRRWPAGSTTTYERWCPTSTRCPSRNRSSPRPCSEIQTSSGSRK